MNGTIALADAGYMVHPLHNPDPSHPSGCSCHKMECAEKKSQAKHPRTNWRDSATRDFDVIADWWERWPDANIGVVTGPASGIFVVDVDGADGEATLAGLPDLPPTVEATTGRGRHLYYRWPEAGGIRNNAGTLVGAGVDIRGDGGYVVAPGSVHISGTRYEWVRDPFDHDLVEAPAWLLGLVTKREQNTSGPRTQNLASVIPNGQRNATLTSMAGALQRKGASREALGAALQADNEQRCDPPLGHDEVEAIADSVARYEPSDVSPNGDNGTSVFASLAELLKNPKLLESPETVVPKLAYRGRSVVLVAQAKEGKTTLAAHGVAAMTRGVRFLGDLVTPGRVVWVGLEEATGDAVRRFVELEAEPDAIRIITRPAADVLERTRDLLTEWPADLVVIDSLAEYARVTLGKAPDSGDAAGWGLVVRPLTRLARDFNIAVLILAHANKGGEYRDSTEIAAAVDAMLTLRPDKHDPTVRNIEGRGRWSIERFSVALRDGRYELASGGELSIDALVLLHIERDPGASRNSIRRAVTGNHSRIDAVVNQLELRGGIENHGTKARARYYTPSGQVSLGVLK